MSVRGDIQGGNRRCDCKQWVGWDFFFLFCPSCLWSTGAVCFLRLMLFTGDGVLRACAFTLSQSEDSLAEPLHPKHPGGLPLTPAWEYHRFKSWRGLMGASRAESQSLSDFPQVQSGDFWIPGCFPEVSLKWSSLFGPHLKNATLRVEVSPITIKNCWKLAADHQRAEHVDICCPSSPTDWDFDALFE